MGTIGEEEGGGGVMGCEGGAKYIEYHKLQSQSQNSINGCGFAKPCNKLFVLKCHFEDEYNP